MEKNNESMRLSVGYIRVSTDMQAKGDVGLEKQARRIRDACLKKNFSLLRVYEDVGTGVGPDNVIRRPGLLDALHEANRSGAILVISDVSRLTRNKDEGERLLKEIKVPVFSVREGRILGKRAILNTIQKAETAAQNIRAGTSQALASKNSGTRAPESVLSQSEKAKKSAQVRSEKAAEIAHKIADVFEREPMLRKLSHEALADLLNREGILSGGNRKWTWAAVRRPRSRAEELIAGRIEHEAAMDAMDSQKDANAIPPSVLANNRDLTEDDVAELKKNPMFGMF